MAYDTLVVNYGNDSTQVRFYNSPILRGKELEEKKKRNKKIKEFRQRKEDKKNANKQIDLCLQPVVDSVDKCERSIKQNANRAKNSIYEYARANAWDYFITFTFNPADVDSTNYDMVLKKIQNFIDVVRRKCPSVKYLLVPEFHADKKKYHFHGLLANCDELDFVESGHFTRDGQIIYNLLNFKWGFTQATRVIDTHRVSGYICKYMTKDTEEHIKGRRRFLCSNNLNKPEKVYLKYDYEQRNMLVDSLGTVKYSKSTAGYRKVVYLEL